MQFGICTDITHAPAVQAARNALPHVRHVHVADTEGRVAPGLSGLLRRQAVVVAFDLASNLEPVLKLMQKYADAPMSLADACLVRMTEMLADPILLTTDSDFHIYRRHSRQVVPSVMPY